MAKIKIGLDADGGDFSPKEAILGSLEAISDSEMSGIEIVLFGNASRINQALLDSNSNINFTIIDCEDLIEMGEHPTKAVSQKRNSSIMKGLKTLTDSGIDAFVSAGNTGAMMVGSLYTARTIEGILRPAISTILPRPNGQHGVLLDVGANSDVKPDVINQFAYIGSVYAKTILKIENPKVGLLSIGEEREKGNIFTQASFPLLEENRQINFIGNVEGRDLFNNKADVIVCDGFTGNIVLKTCEGMFYNFMKRGIKDDYLNMFNFENYGGSPILGINKPVIIGHGISKAKTFKNMIKLAKDVVESGMIDKIKASL